LRDDDFARIKLRISHTCVNPLSVTLSASVFYTVENQIFIDQQRWKRFPVWSKCDHLEL